MHSHSGARFLAASLALAALLLRADDARAQADVLLGAERPELPPFPEPEPRPELELPPVAPPEEREGELAASASRSSGSRGAPSSPPRIWPGSPHPGREG